jgi:hypothetical protein
MCLPFIFFCFNPLQVKAQRSFMGMEFVMQPALNRKKYDDMETNRALEKPSASVVAEISEVWAPRYRQPAYKASCIWSNFSPSLQRNATLT